jgi:hypothetical protein
MFFSKTRAWSVPLDKIKLIARSKPIIRRMVDLTAKFFRVLLNRKRF